MNCKVSAERRLATLEEGEQESLMAIKGTSSEEEIVIGETFRCFVGGEARSFSGEASSRGRGLVFFFALSDLEDFFNLSFFSTGFGSEGLAESERDFDGEVNCLAGSEGSRPDDKTGAEDGRVAEERSVDTDASPISGGRRDDYNKAVRSLAARSRRVLFEKRRQWTQVSVQWPSPRHTRHNECPSVGGIFWEQRAHRLKNPHKESCIRARKRV